MLLILRRAKETLSKSKEDAVLALLRLDTWGLLNEDRCTQLGRAIKKACGGQALNSAV